MKQKFVLSFLILLILSSQVSALDYTIGYQVHDAQYNYVSKLGIYSRNTATDGYDEERKLNEPYSSYPNMNIALHKVAGIDGWNWDTGFYEQDFRESIFPGQSVAFDFYVWADPSVDNREMTLAITRLSLADDMNYRLSLLYTPSGTTYSGPNEWSVSGPCNEFGDTIIAILPFYTTDNGLTGYKFRAEITAVPEPSSLLVLGGAVASAIGYALRRTRHQ